MIQTKKHLKNEEIKFPKVMTIGSDGKPLGEMKIRDAMRAAREEGLDLVLVAPNSNPPTCRIADYGKMEYDAARKEKEGRRNRKKQEIKELRLTPGIADNDLRVKGRAAEKFLKEGCKVKAVCRFRGREAARPSDGEEVLAKLAELVSEFGEAEKPPVKEGRRLSTILVPVRRDRNSRRENGERKQGDGQDVHILPKGD